MRSSIAEGSPAAVMRLAAVVLYLYTPILPWDTLDIIWGVLMLRLLVEAWQWTGRDRKYLHRCGASLLCIVGFRFLRLAPPPVAAGASALRLLAVAVAVIGPPGGPRLLLRKGAGVLSAVDVLWTGTAGVLLAYEVYAVLVMCHVW